jgi:hypothetical protein
MTAEHPHADDLAQRPADADQPDTAQPDPIGPITLPKRSKVGARAMALVGTASVAAFAVHAAIDYCSTDTTIIDG